MEYGYEITDMAGNKRFFVEGCTYCSMSTGGLHEMGCPLYKPASDIHIGVIDKSIKEAWVIAVMTHEYSLPNQGVWKGNT